MMKNDLLDFARGAKPKTPRIMAYLVIKDGTTLTVEGAGLIGGEKDWIIKQCSTSDDVKFFKEFDESDLVEKIRMVLIEDLAKGITRIKPVFP